MNFSFDKNSLIFFENSIEINHFKKILSRSNQLDFIENVNFKSLDSFIRDELSLFWVLIEETESPSIISRESSICILYKIIEDRRIFDSFFIGLNSSDIFIANKVYSIMLDSAKHNIPVVESASRIERFKRGMVKNNLYLDLENVIREYRSVLDLFGIIDLPMIFEKYSLLLKNKEYTSYLAKRKYFLANKIYENRTIYNKIMKNEELEKDTFILGDYIIRKVDICSENSLISNLFADDIIEEKKYEAIDISNIREKTDIAQLNEYKYEGKVYDLDFENYFEMEQEVAQLIKSLLDSGIKEKDIAFIVPKNNCAIVSMLDSIKEKFSVSIESVSDYSKINTSKVALSSIVAYAVKGDYNRFLNEDDQVEFVKFILDGIIKNSESKKIFMDLYKIDTKEVNYIYIRRNLNKLMSMILNDERILPPKAKSNDDVREYVKKFFKMYGEINEENIHQISKISNIIGELSIFDKKDDNQKFILSEEKKLEYIINYLSTFTVQRRRLEKVNLDRIVLLTYKDYIDMKLDRKIKIIFDAKSPLYDEKIEDELNTQVAYLKDEILSEIPTDNGGKKADSIELGKLSRKLLDKKIKGKMSIFFGDNVQADRIYLLSSYKSLAGYEQENRFYKILTQSIQGSIETL